MENEKSPDSLFKYTTFETAVKTINNSSLRWSSVSEFNDPFEYKFRFFTNGNENAVTTRFIAANFIHDPNSIEMLKSNASLQLLRIKFINKKIQFQEIEKQINNLLIASDFNTINKKPLNAMNAYKDTFLKTIPIQMKNILDVHTGVLCLTDDSDDRSSRLMWSHYADCHKGVRIKINTKYIKEISESIKSGIRKVHYQEDFPLIEYDDYLGFSVEHFPNSTRNLVNKMIFTKSDEWKYENEYRSIIPLKGTSRIISVDKNAFDSIYLGLNMPLKNRDEIIKTAKKNMPNINIFNTVQEDNSYKLKYIQI